MSIFDRERSEIAKLFSEELELGLYSLSSEATYRVISVDGIPAQHTILISCYNDEVYLPFESRSNTNRLTVTDLKGCGTVVTVEGHDYEIMKGATYEDSRKVDDLLDSHGDKPISDYRKRPQGMSLKQAVRESREASAKLAEENVGTDVLGKDAR